MSDLADAYTTTLGFRGSEGLGLTATANRKALVESLVEVIEGGREGLSELYHDDIVFHEADCLPYGGAHRGKAATIAAVGKLYEYYDQLHTDVEEVTAAGDLAIIYLHVAFRVRSNGRTGRFPACELYRFQDGKIIEWRVCYFDSNMVAQALAD